MGPSAAGAVVLITFPFSDLSDAKVRRLTVEKATEILAAVTRTLAEALRHR